MSDFRFQLVGGDRCLLSAQRPHRRFECLLVRGDETLFRDRASGVNVLAATSTLAQGLNLPCEVVILASTDRVGEGGPDDPPREPLMPHEILNALGRAGRAGQAATGLAIVIPSSPIGCNLTTKEVLYDEGLAVIFSESDQCLPLADPLTTLFDQIEITGSYGKEADYLLRRLATSLGQERQGTETFESLARRSFGFFQRSRTDAAAAELWLANRKATLTAVLRAAAPPPALPWHEELAAKTGASSAFVSSLATAYESAPIGAIDAIDWVLWVVDQLNPHEDVFDSVLRPETMERVFGRSISSQHTAIERRRVALGGIRLVLPLWLGGKPLVEIERAIATYVAANEGVVGRATGPDRMAKRARRFATRLAPDLGFLCGVVAQVAQRMATESGGVVPPMIGFLPQLVRRGYQTPYHFAISRDVPGASRPDIQNGYDAVQAEIERQPSDDWATVREKLDRANLSHVFDDLSYEELEAALVATGGKTIAI